MAESQKANQKQQEAIQEAIQLGSHQAARTADNGLQANLPNGETSAKNSVLEQPKPMSDGTANNGSINSNSSIAGKHHSSNNGLIDGSNSDDKKAKANPPIDEESLMGHFGWTKFENICIPFIYRQTEKYCSVRILDMKVLGNYLNSLHSDIFSSCTCVYSYYMTEAEARLFIEINEEHCNGEFGPDKFTQEDIIVRLDDAVQFYYFVRYCYRRLICANISMRCGFIRINNESVVPYILRNGVPLFCFKKETKDSEIKQSNLQGWDLAYLKFCLKVQGIRRELLSSKSVAVISFTDLKSQFPNGTQFENYWPSKVTYSNLLIDNRPNASTSVNWTRPETAMTTSSNQTSSHSVALPAVSETQHQQQQNLMMGHRPVVNSPHFNFARNQQAARDAIAAGHRMLTQATVQALLANPWIPPRPMLHVQMLAPLTPAVTNAANHAQYRNSMDNIIFIGSRQPIANSNTAMSMPSSNNHNLANSPPPMVRSASESNVGNDESKKRRL